MSPRLYGPQLAYRLADPLLLSLTSIGDGRFVGQRLAHAVAHGQRGEKDGARGAMNHSRPETRTSPRPSAILLESFPEVGGHNVYRHRSTTYEPLSLRRFVAVGPARYAPFSGRVRYAGLDQTASERARRRVPA